MTENQSVAHQAAVYEETLVGTKDSGRTAVTDIELPSGCDHIHPDLADRLRDEYDIKHFHKFGVYVATEYKEETE